MTTVGVVGLMRIRRALTALIVLGEAGNGVELGFDTRFKEAETSCRFSVNRQFVADNWSDNREGM